MVTMILEIVPDFLSPPLVSILQYAKHIEHMAATAALALLLGLNFMSGLVFIQYPFSISPHFSQIILSLNMN